MADFLCKSCDFEKYPECVICNIVNAKSLNDILNDAISTKNPFLVCKYNAQDFDGKTMKINKFCSGCNLCKIICKFGNKKLIVDEDLILSDLSRLNIYLSKLFPEYLIATEITVNGNFRKKRLDLVIKKNHEVLLVKVLSNIDKYGYYYRSYTEVIDELMDKFKNFNFIFKCLVKEKQLEKCNELSYENVITIEKLINRLNEE